VSRARTLLVGGNDVFLDGIVEWIANDTRLTVVGRTHSGARALELIDALGADLVLMDVTLPDMNGFEVTRRIAERADAPLVVLLSFHDSHVARLEAWAAGADGFVATSEITECLTPLVGDLLRRRDERVEEQGSVIPFKRVPPTDLSK
jgi:two-component system, LytTR family, response regulator AlgR